MHRSPRWLRLVVRGVVTAGHRGIRLKPADRAADVFGLLARAAWRSGRGRRRRASGRGVAGAVQYAARHRDADQRPDNPYKKGCMAWCMVPLSIGCASSLAVGETVILLHPPLHLVGVSMWMKRGCQ